MKSGLMVALSLTATAVFSTSASAQFDGYWNNPTGSNGCESACLTHGSGASTGTWTGGVRTKFYICKVNYKKEGYRAGYNLDAAYGKNKCVIGYGGKEVAVDVSDGFQCLCNNPISNKKK